MDKTKNKENIMNTKIEIKEMIEELNIEDYSTLDKRTYSLYASTTKLIDKISEATGVNKTKIVSIFLTEMMNKLTLKEMEALFKKRLM